MIRSRREGHIQALQRRFPELSALKILKFDGHDYGYRIIVAKELWASLIADLAREQTWPNFKDEVNRFQGIGGSEYTSTLHKVWGVMKQFQELAPTDADDQTTESESEPAALWDGIISADVASDDSDRQDLANYARDYDWNKVLQLVVARPELINTTRPGGHSLFAPLHQAAHGGADLEVIQQLIDLGGWRTLRNAEGERPFDIAKHKRHAHLLEILSPIHKRTVSDRILARIQTQFHELIRGTIKDLPTSDLLRLPELEPTLEYDRKHFWFPVPGMCGGFHYWLVCDGPEARLAVQSWCRGADGSGRQYDITAQKTTLVDKEFV